MVRGSKDTNVLGTDGQEGRIAMERLGVRSLPYNNLKYHSWHKLSLYFEGSAEPWQVEEWWHVLTQILKGFYSD